MTSSMTLIPYLFVAAYGLKLAWTGETYAAEGRSRAVDWIRGAVATVYAAGMIYAGGAKFLLLSALLYAPGTALFIIARREQKKTAFTLVEALLFGVILVAAAAGLYSLATGAISI
jgi:arginine:ornithine antiporter/lysine permease